MRAIAGYIGAEPEGNVADTISHLSGATDHALINPFTCLHRERIFRYFKSVDSSYFHRRTLHSFSDHWVSGWWLFAVAETQFRSLSMFIAGCTIGIFASYETIITTLANMLKMMKWLQSITRSLEVNKMYENPSRFTIFLIFTQKIERNMYLLVVHCRIHVHTRHMYFFLFFMSCACFLFFMSAHLSWERLLLAMHDKLIIVELIFFCSILEVMRRQ